MEATRPKPFKFTVPSLEALKQLDKPYEVADTGQPGLSCRVLVTGVKTLQVFKRPKGSHKLVRVTICKVGALPLDGPDGVRGKARMIISQLEKGINPNEAARQSKVKESAKGLTLRKALDDFLTSDRIIQPGKPTSKKMIKASTAKGYRQRIEKHLSDWLDIPIETITPAMVEERHTEIARTHYSAANNALRAFRRIYNHALKATMKKTRRNLLPPNPAEFMADSWLDEKPRTDHVPLDDISAWWQATEQLPEHFPDGELGRDFLQFVLLSGLRRREATNLLTWEYIDLANKRFSVPDTKNHEEQQLPLSDYMIEILKRRDDLSDRPFPLTEVKKFYIKIAEIMEAEQHVTIHGLRRTFVTVAESMDISKYALKALVNHKLPKDDITATYIQMNVERLRKTMMQITDYILKAAGVKKTDVVAIGSES